MGHDKLEHEQDDADNHLREAKADLSFLRLRRTQIEQKLQFVAKFVGCIGRDADESESIPGNMRILVENSMSELSAALDLSALLQLDNELFAATERLATAEINLK